MSFGSIKSILIVSTVLWPLLKKEVAAANDKTILKVVINTFCEFWKLTLSEPAIVRITSRPPLKLNAVVCCRRSDRRHFLKLISFTSDTRCILLSPFRGIASDELQYLTTLPIREYKLIKSHNQVGFCKSQDTLLHQLALRNVLPCCKQFLRSQSV